MLRMLGAPLVAAVLMAGCSFEDRSDEDSRRTAGDTAQARPAQPQMLLEVDIASRQLNVYRDNRVVESHPVAVGSAEWPTPTGEWDVGQVIFNPRWVPPEESWAEDEEVAEPGDPDNPLGKAQLVYRAPNSIHGTNEPESLGQAVSHGSIRVANDVAIKLARMVLEAGGATTSEQQVQQALADSTQRVDIPIPNPVPIRVVAGPVAGVAPVAGDSARADSGAAR
ncbi:MAG TPA: L,D-transpeptidase [Longimicrobiales bacterium]